MPCDQVRNVTMDLHIADRESLLAALKELGYQPEDGVYIRFWVDGTYCVIGKDRRGRRTIQVPAGFEDVVKQIKRKTSEQIVKRLAARMRWVMKQTGNFTFTVQKGPEDKMKVEILPDGVIKTTVDGHISPANHSSAEAFLREQARMAGGAMTMRRNNKQHEHKIKHEHHHKNQ